MTIAEILAQQQYLPAIQQRTQQQSTAPEGQTFAATLKEFLSDVNTLQKTAAQQAEKFIAGEPVQLHDVMIAAEKAKVSMELLLEIRNRAIDLYREIIRIQV